MKSNTSGLARFGFRLIAVLVVVLLCFVLWYLRSSYLQSPDHKVIRYSSGGEWDLTDIDFDSKFANIRGEVAYIPGVLLTPQAFAESADKIQYGATRDNAVNTARLRLHMPGDEPYMITVNSVDFSERIFINGELRQEVGAPGLTAEETAEGFAQLAFEVRPIDGWIEIVRQSANFVHRENGDNDDIRIGRPALVARELAIGTDLAGLTIGMYFALAIAHSMLYWLMRRYRPNLLCMLLCLTMAMRTGVTGDKVIAQWFPSLPWELLFRLEYLTIPLSSLLILLIVRELFPGVLPKWFTGAMGAFFALFGMLCVFLPTYPLSYGAVASQAGMILCALFMSICVSVRMPRMQRDDTLREAQWVTRTGLWLLSIGVINDALYYNNINIIPYHGLIIDLMMMILIILLMGAVFSATMRRAAQAQVREQRMADERRALEEEGRRRTAFYTDISHELKTPLAVIAANAQFAAQNIRAGLVDEETGIDLDAISTEAKRLAQMVTGLVSLGRMQEDGGGKAPFALDRAIEDTAHIYGSLTGKRGNALVVSVAPDLPQVWGNADQLSQVLINLLGNANRHTRNGCITVMACRQGDGVYVAVADTGEGIAPELLPTVFERFVRSSEDGTGLGLPICRTIITAHDGDIGIESEVGKGTTVWFTLPPKEDDSNA